MLNLPFYGVQENDRLFQWRLVIQPTSQYKRMTVVTLTPHEVKGCEPYGELDEYDY